MPPHNRRMPQAQLRGSPPPVQVRPPPKHAHGLPPKKLPGHPGRRAPAPPQYAMPPRCPNATDHTRTPHTATAVPNARTMNSSAPKHPPLTRAAPGTYYSARACGTAGTKTTEHSRCAQPAPTPGHAAEPHAHAQTPTEEYVPQPPTGHAPTDSHYPSKKCAAKTRAPSPEVPAHAKPTGCVPIVPTHCSSRTRRTAPPHPLPERAITAHRARDNRANGAPQAKNRRHPSTPPAPNWQQARMLPHECQSQ